MKPVTSLRNLFIVPLLLLCFAVISAQYSVQETKEMTLMEAIKSGTIEAEAISIGKYSGKSVKLVATNKTNKSVKIKVPGGTAYVPGEDEEQTLIQLEDDFFVLEPNGKNVHMIAAFCTEAHDMSPSDGGKFKILTHSNKQLNEAITYLKDKKNIDKKSFQDVVWAITDGHSVSHIEASTPETQQLRTYLATLTGQKDTWYTTPQYHAMNEERRIVSQTVIVRGKVEFPSDGTSIIKQEVVDSNGEVKFAMPPATPRSASNVKMDFSVKVQGWPPGEYSLRILKDDVEIKAYPFTLES